MGNLIVCHRRRRGTLLRARAGFTLVELMVSVAMMVLLIGSVFAVNFRVSGLWASERGRSEMQQNFRFALDAITDQVRQANTVSLPGDNGFGETLAFTWTDEQGVTYSVQYSMVDTASGRQVQREQTPVSGGATVVTPISEELSSLAALHFVRSGRRIVIMAVARYDVLGAEKTISYTTQTFVRSSGVGSPY